MFEPNVPVILGNQFEPFIIPCKPTSPRVKVELLNQDGEVIKFLSYSETIGFEIKTHFNDDNEGFVTCNGTFNKKVQEINIIYRNESGMSSFQNL